MKSILNRRKWNKKGNIFFGVIVGLTCWVFGVMFIPYLSDLITSARIDLGCSVAGITSGTMFTCLLVDIWMPYFIWFFISLTLGIITGRNT